MEVLCPSMQMRTPVSAHFSLRENKPPNSYRRNSIERPECVKADWRMVLFLRRQSASRDDECQSVNECAEWHGRLNGFIGDRQLLSSLTCIDAMLTPSAIKHDV